MTVHSLRVNLGERSYDILVTAADLAGAGPFARQRAQGSTVLVVTDDNVVQHAVRVSDVLSQVGFRTTLAVRPAGEARKSLEVARALYDRLLDLPADRRTLIVAVGG